MANVTTELMLALRRCHSQMVWQAMQAVLAVVMAHQIGIVEYDYSMVCYEEYLWSAGWHPEQNHG